MECVVNILKESGFEPQDELHLSFKSNNENLDDEIEEFTSCFSDEIELKDVLFFLDSGFFTTKGILLTSDKIYIPKNEPIRYEDIKYVDSTFSDFRINKISTSLDPLTASNTQVLVHALKKIRTQVQSILGIDNTNISKDIESSSDLQDEGKREEFVKDVISTIEFDLSDPYLHLNPDLSNKKNLKMMNNAINSFAKGVDPEDVILLLDGTIFKSAKKGVLLTKDKIYNHIFPPVSYFELKEAGKIFGGIEVNGKGVLVETNSHNNKSLATGLNFIATRFDNSEEERESYKEFTKKSNSTTLDWILQFIPEKHQLTVKKYFNKLLFAGVALIILLVLLSTEWFKMALSIAILLGIGYYFTKDDSSDGYVQSSPRKAGKTPIKESIVTDSNKSEKTKKDIKNQRFMVLKEGSNNSSSSSTYDSLEEAKHAVRNKAVPHNIFEDNTNTDYGVWEDGKKIADKKWW